MFNCLKKIQHFFRTPRGTIVVKLGMQCSEEVEKVKSLRHTDGLTLDSLRSENIRRVQKVLLEQEVMFQDK